MRGRKSNIAPEIKNQVRAMKKEGQKPRKIVLFVKRQYGIDIKPYHIFTWMRAKKDLPVPEIQKATAPKNAADIISDIHGLLDEMQNLHLNQLKAIRQELLEKCAKLKEVEEIAKRRLEKE